MQSTFIMSIVLAIGFLSISGAEQESCHPVDFADVSIVCFKNGVGSFNAETRSQLVHHKIQSLAQDYTFNPENITVIDSEGSFLILGNDLPIVALGKRDLPREDSKVSLADYAGEVAKNIKKSIIHYRESRTPEAISAGLIYSIIATLALILLIYIFIKMINFIKNKLFMLSDKYVEGFQIKSYKFLSAFRLKQIIDGTASLWKAFVILSLFYFYVPLELSFFPWTAKYSSQIVAYVLEPFKKVFLITANYLPNIFYILVIFIITHYSLKFIKLFFNEIQRGSIQFSGFHQEWAQPTFRLIQCLFYALALVMAFPYLPGSSSPAFQGLSVFFGVLISFGSGSAIANIISGVVITYMRPFKIGDRVKIADTVGDIIEKSFLVTRVRTIKNVDITIPNSMVLGSHIINYSSSAVEEGLILNTTVTIGYDAPWEVVHQLLISAALKTSLVDQKKKPFVLQTALNDFYVSYELNAYTQHANNMAQIYSELHQNIQNSFNEGGVEIMSPHYGSLRDGNETTIPAHYREAGYQPPVFNVNNSVDTK